MRQSYPAILPGRVLGTADPGIRMLTGQGVLFHDKGNFIKHVHIQILENVVRGNVAEQGNLVFDALVQRFFRAADKDIGWMPIP